MREITSGLDFCSPAVVSLTLSASLLLTPFLLLLSSATLSVSAPSHPLFDTTVFFHHAEAI
ncbi:MAG: hypothetical protein QXM16_03225 [Nitrososphaerota archaeon]